MIRIGITGGIGTGKTTVSKAFGDHFEDVPLYLMDDRNKYVIDNDNELREKLIKQFGQNVFLPDGSYNRKFVANIVFNDKAELDLLSSNIGKHLKRDYEQFCEANSNAPYIIVESAYFYEYKIDDWVDFMIGVDATYPVRVSRAQTRDNATYQEIVARMKNQMEHTEKMTLCDFVIDNNERYDVVYIYKLNDLFRKINDL